MDVKRIGVFLAQLRAERHMTQEQLGEKLGVTNKTVSRWENGNYLPPVEMLQALSELYGISMNEILSARRLSTAEYREKAEENLSSVMAASAFCLKEKTDYYGRKWDDEHRVGIVGYCLIAGATVALCLLTKSAVWVSAGFIAELGFYLYRRNQKMAYVERHAFDGSGQQ